jgi:hypothetical protein
MSKTVSSQEAEFVIKKYLLHQIQQVVNNYSPTEPYITNAIERVESLLERYKEGRL